MVWFPNPTPRPGEPRPGPELRGPPRGGCVGVGLRVPQDVLFYSSTVLVLGFGEKTLHYARGTMLGGVATGAAVGLFTIPLFGALSDRFGRRPVYLAGAVADLL